LAIAIRTPIEVSDGIAPCAAEAAIRPRTTDLIDKAEVVRSTAAAERVGPQPPNQDIGTTAACELVCASEVDLEFGTGGETLSKEMGCQ
jgi:hypothetical protein